MGLPVATISLLLVVAGCQAREAGNEPLAGERAAPAPADRGDLCLDVADGRACWGAAGEAAWVDRPVPPGPAPPSGWRCRGQGGARRCVDRAVGAGSFVCQGRACVQGYPRMPDDGIWECVDLAGAVICRGGGPAAGVVPGPEDPAWRCGPRGRGGAPGERVCVDLAPDLPDGDPSGWTCRFEHVPRERRICTRRPRRGRIGGPCGPAGGCPEGARCIDARCLPDRPEPACWFDTDCAAGQRCMLTSCVASS